MYVKKQRGSLVINLINFINSSNKKGVDYEIAKVILNNINIIENIGIIELSELCFVSTATLSRFFKHMDYENFQEFKKAASLRFRIEDDYSDELKYEAINNPNEALKHYTESIERNIKYISENIDVSCLDSVANIIHDSKRVGVFGAHAFNSIALQFQHKLILNGKFVEAYYSSVEQFECAKEMDKDCLAIIISVEGSFLYRYMDIIDELKRNNVKIVLITQNVNSKFASLADKVMICGNSNNNGEGRFAAMYIIELLIMRYGFLNK